MHPFRTAIEARDISAAVALFAEGIELRSPVSFRPYRGRDELVVMVRPLSGALALGEAMKAQLSQEGIAATAAEPDE